LTLNLVRDLDFCSVTLSCSSCSGCSSSLFVFPSDSNFKGRPLTTCTVWNRDPNWGSGLLFIWFPTGSGGVAQNACGRR